MNHAHEAAHTQGNHSHSVSESWGEDRLSHYSQSMPNLNIQEFERR
jgi:hypothetical protein